VKVIAGEDGVTICRSLLDGIDDGGEAELQSRVTEGRCSVCMGSTFEDDLPEGDEVILCDGCNAEAHIRCLNMSSVPSSEWHCSACAERMAAREARVKHSFGDVESHRSREAEDALVIQALDRKVCQMPPDDNELSCAYCGLSEYDVCSPMVVGQSRVEHDSYVMMCKPATADGIIPGKKDTKVKFIVNGEFIETPTLEVPYFPYVNSEHGRQILEEAAQEDERTKGQSPIVHEMCALQMFQARMDRER
jgi:PHD-finger